LNRIEVKVEEKRMVEDDRRWVRGAECDGGKGMHEQDGFCTWSPILALSLRICKDIKIGLCASNRSGFGSVRPIERRINANIEI